MEVERVTLFRECVLPHREEKRLGVAVELVDGEIELMRCPIVDDHNEGMAEKGE